MNPPIIEALDGANLNIRQRTRTNHFGREGKRTPLLGADAFALIEKSFLHEESDARKGEDAEADFRRVSNHGL